MDVTLDRVAPRTGSFIARYHGSNGKKKEDLASEAEVEALKADLAKEQFSGLHGQAHPEAAPARATLHHLYSPAGGLPQAEYDAPAHYVHRPAAL